MQAAPLAVGWIWILMLGGAAGVPFAGVPRPVDPALAAVAPEECLFYVSYAGQQAPAGDSSNQTEQLFAEPQIQRFVTELKTQVMKAVRKQAGAGPQQQALLENVPPLLTTLLGSPSVLYVEDVRPAGGGAEVEAGVVVAAGDQRKTLEKSIAKLLAMAGPNAPPMSQETIANVVWSRLQTPPDAPPVRWGWKDGYLLIAIGEKTPGQIVARLAGSPPAWLEKVRADHKQVERESSLLRIDVAGILERVQPLVAKENPEAWPIVERLGLTSVREITSRMGFDAEGCIASSHLATDGQRRGVLAFLPHEPLETEDLSLVPKDALIAVAVRLNPSEVWDDALALATQFHPEAEAELEEGLAEARQNLGIDVREDLVDSLGDAWTAYLPGGDLMSSWLNSAIAVRVKDHDRLERAVTKLCAIAQLQIPPEDAAIAESQVGDNTLYTLQLIRNPAPVSPAWCVSDEWLVLGLNPQAVRAAVERAPDASLAEAETVSGALTVEGGAAFLGYQDTPRLVQSVYPWLQMLGQMAAGQLRKEGIEIDPSILPTSDVIVKHLRPSVSTWSHGSDGFRSITRSSLPSGGGGPVAAGVGVALGLPAIQAARDAARNAQDINSMKQIALAAFNYESVHKHFPADVVDANGKPLLSWRVELLPYLEQGDLYNKLHRDEPWDSPHNAALLAETPQVFQSQQEPGPPGTTCFLGLGGPHTIWEKGGGVQLREITDGTSNTIMLVKADGSQAVPWAKPADLPFDPENPRQGLTGGRRGIAAAFCDGSVRMMGWEVSDESLVKLSTKDAGEAVEY